jgi:hypothetical protein
MKANVIITAIAAFTVVLIAGCYRSQQRPLAPINIGDMVKDADELSHSNEKIKAAIIPGKKPRALVRYAPA